MIGSKTTVIAQCALEYWRGSGPRTRQRLAELVYHFARYNNELNYLDYHQQSANAAVRSWEWQS
jgi:hypothetical protein